MNDKPVHDMYVPPQWKDCYLALVTLCDVTRIGQSYAAVEGLLTILILYLCCF